MTSNDRLDFQKGLSEQKLDAKYLVLYNSSAKDANSTIVEREKIDLDFIVESKTYVYYTNSLNEANYLCTILNSSIPNLMMKDFQSKGLFGARDVHKKILNVYFPKFDKKDNSHLILAELGRTCHERANSYVTSNPPKDKLTPYHLGRYRLDIKKHLTKELKEIDKLVKKFIQ